MSLHIPINLEDLLREQLDGYTCVPVAVDLHDVIDAIDAEDLTVDVDEMLFRRRLIGETWNVQLVREQRPDLSDDQAWNVLRACERHFETLTNLLGELARQTAFEMYPAAPRAKQSLLDRLEALRAKLQTLPTTEQTNPDVFVEAAARLDAFEAEISKGGVV